MIKCLLDDRRLKEKAGDVVRYAKKLPDEVLSLPKEVKQKRMKIVQFDELEILSNAKEFLGRELKASIEIYSEDDPERHDPGNKALLTRPYRPAIYIE